MAGSFSKRSCADRIGGLFAAGLAALILGRTLPAAPADDIAAVQAKYAEFFNRLPTPVHHLEGFTEAEMQRRAQRARSFRELRREQGDTSWFAALLSLEPADAFAIKARFATWRGLMDFIQERDAIVEVWACPEDDGAPPRRLSAGELAALRMQQAEPPTFVTLTYRTAPGGAVVQDRVEFGFQAAERAYVAAAGYQRHRETQTSAVEILGARNADGRLDAFSQWDALVQATAGQRFTLAEMPAQPTNHSDFFVAFEYEVDELNNFTRALRIYRESELQRRVARDSPTQYVQTIFLRRPGDKEGREARGFQTRGVGDALEPAPSPVPGQDYVELRIKNPREPDVRKWNVLEFGEPELLQQSALARFSLIQAHLEKQRKALAIKKSNVDLLVEPIFAGLNITGGLVAFPFPIGAAARLGYNSLVTPWFIPAIPTVRQMRELFQLLAARERHPQLRTKPAEFLDDQDIRQLQATARDLTDAEVADYLQRITDEDVRGMLRIAKMQRWDTRLTTLLAITADAGRVSGWTETSGFQREVFNSIYFSVTGEVSIKNIIAALAGGKVATPASGISLRTLSQGHGPQEAWLQYLNLTVDIRAILNTAARLSHRDLADKELRKPFPYAPRLSDAAAYEISIFGFPLLIFYKRGLLKADAAAFDNDYAYGLLGATIVEHFASRRELDAEIRAGRLVPLGYVRVPNGLGSWKETSLAVFAHRIAQGKHAGKTAMILYGLRAYQEHSDLIEREYQRYKQLEAGRRQGAVIEQLIEAQDRDRLDPAEFEPRFHLEPEASEQLYARLLSHLLERRRDARRQALGLARSPAEADEIERLTHELGALGIPPGPDDPLVAVDAFNSAFLYQRQVNGQRHLIRLTRLPGRDDLNRDLAKAIEGWQTAQIRQRAVTPEGEGVVLINSVKVIQGRHEVGPLVRGRDGALLGAGLRPGARALDELLAQVDQLPAADRARFQFNHFAATELELDADGDGIAEKVFVTIEFPRDQDRRRAWTNPLSGEREEILYRNGQTSQIVTDRRIVELDHDEADLESRTRVYQNAGTRAAPAKGLLLGETRTLETWVRDLRLPNVDPLLPVLAKLRVDYVTGQAAREIYGLFPSPMERVDEQFITRNQFNPHGIFLAATVSDNGVDEAQFQRAALDKLLQPVAGAGRFVLTATDAGVAGLRHLQSLAYRATVERRDLARGLVHTLVFDLARSGRKVSDSYLDPFDGTRAFGATVTSDYRDDFFYGSIPFRAEVRSTAGGALLAEATTLSYDPLRRLMTAREVDYTGKATTQTWEERWEQPVAIETERRRTVLAHNRTETAFNSSTSARPSGEELAVVTGQYDSAGRVWNLQRTGWYRAGITNRVTLETLSPFGKVMAVRSGAVLEARPVYDVDGREIGSRWSRPDPATGRFELPVREEDDYHWRAGERDARVQTFLDGRRHDVFRILADSEGRLTTDHVVLLPELSLRTVLTYDGASERVVRSEQLQNDQLRIVRTPGLEQRQSNGTWLVPVWATPVWGLTATQTFLIGDPLARPIETQYENGDRVQVQEWFAGTAVAKLAMAVDRHGRPRERLTAQPAAGHDRGIPFDRLERARMNFWGQAGGPPEVEALVQGTDIALFTETESQRTYHDLSKPFKLPWFTVDPSGAFGIGVTVRQTRQTNVVRLHTGQVRPANVGMGMGMAMASNAGPVLELASVDLRGLFYHKITTQIVDRAGRLLEETVGRISNLGEIEYSDQAVFSAPATPLKKMRYQYEPGWLIEHGDAGSRHRTADFSPRPPPNGERAHPINDSPWRELPTQIEGVQRATEEKLEVADVNFRSMFRRIHSPRELESNPYMPDQAGVWTSWTSTEFRTYGQKLFDAEMIYDGHGLLRVARATKTTSAGRPAVKITYHLSLPPREGWTEHRPARAPETISLATGGRSDFAGSDFIYCYVAGASNATLRITDQVGASVEAGAGPPDLPRRRIATWLPEQSNVRWLPDAALPTQGTVVTAPEASTNELLIVSVHDLARAGLDIRRLRSFAVSAARASAAPVNVSGLFHLDRGGEFVADDAPGETTRARERHSSGLDSFLAAPATPSPVELDPGSRVGALTECNGLPVASSRARASHVEYPHTIVMDYSDTDSPRPLYAIALEAGQFIEHYKLIKLGDAQVYSLVQGFELPRLEVYNGETLEDEITPGYIAYGNNYEVTIGYARGRGPIGRFRAGLQNRVAGNGFKFAGDRLLRRLTGADTRPEFYSHLDFSALQDAPAQAAEIERLPLLAQALLPAKEVPWAASPPANPSELLPDWRTLALTLHRLQLLYPTTGLIPTAPGTESERYVDTVAESDLIILATQLGEPVLARELLSFYWEKSQGGQAPLHASYDAVAGTAMTADLSYRRAVHSRRTAAAQLAIAEAAFQLGVSGDDPQWLTLGRNLTGLVLREFRPAAGAGVGHSPRGITEIQSVAARQLGSLRLWPQAEVYELRSNARAYLLLSHLNSTLARYGSDAPWSAEIGRALAEQERWLRTFILPQVEQTGVVPNRVFQVQDISRATTALAVNRWTASEDWLCFLEAAHRMGIPDATTRHWLDNLARVHGVRVGAAWGLDWTLAMIRPDAISTELTAKFFRVARLLNHEPAAQLAREQLRALEQAGAYPAVVTAASPQRAIRSGEGSNLHPQTNHTGWPDTLRVYKELREAGSPGWDLSRITRFVTRPVNEAWPPQRTDLTVFIAITAFFYLSVLVSTLFWWRFRALRRREPAAGPGQVVPDEVMQRAEERWAKRVLGLTIPAGSEHSRYSNAPVEQNFLMQLRAIYKLVLEWRRRENGWKPDDARLADAASDPWLNGLDELACLIGLYMRWVIKAGAKDGFPQKDPLAENEDSNHIWSRLTMYFAEYYWALLPLLKEYSPAEAEPGGLSAEAEPFGSFPGLGGDPADHYRAEMTSKIMLLLNVMGLRRRLDGFDARVLFDCPAHPAAFDLLLVQRPGQTLTTLMHEASNKLAIPFEHIQRVIGGYKEFKRRERPDPIHPYLIEFAKVLPHFLLMGVGALVWYNQTIGDSPIVPYLWSIVARFALAPSSLVWELPLLGAAALGIVARITRIYRHDASMLPREKGGFLLDATVTSLFVREQTVIPASNPSRWWNPALYERAGWALRVLGFFWLGLVLLRLDTPSFTTFLVVKGLLAMLAFAEVAGILLPAAGTLVSKALQDRVTRHPQGWKLTVFLNRLNITATRPGSPLWLSIRYHSQPSVPSGDVPAIVQAVLFYFAFAAVFFFAGGYLSQEVLALWFTDTYLKGADLKLLLGGFLFWNTMYLLRYGLFVLFTGVASALATFPLKAVVGLLAVTDGILALFGPALGINPGIFKMGAPVLVAGLGLLALEDPMLRWWRRGWSRNKGGKPSPAVILPLSSRKGDRTAAPEPAAAEPRPVSKPSPGSPSPGGEGRGEGGLCSLSQRVAENTRLGVVYMSGDDLSYLKLTPGLLMTRWRILRDKLGSRTIPMLARLTQQPDDTKLEAWFKALYEAEQKADATLWHPCQLCVTGQAPALQPELGLNLFAPDAATRRELLDAWHLRRWLVAMMSTAGHSQDTGVNLVDIALRLEQEGLAAHTVFYLIQNKFDANDNNRPSQTAYGSGELNQRNKLTRLLGAVAPGARAFNLQNWTPFGFKAGGLTAMDLVYEESLRLTSMLLLDRNATVHDLDGLMQDLGRALSDPDVVIVIPGRSTTNTLTAVGQGSQMVEEGHRSFLRGLLSVLGGAAGESVGTGWGNLLAMYYGRVQRAMLDLRTPRMPLTSRMQRGASYRLKFEGLIGFAPHAVGISEDTWAVSQTTHNALALGRRPKFLLSHAIWHKIRETWSHSEWLASFPRWSGGYLQMMHDPIMQRINDFGSATIFAKEVRANSGRSFLSAPFALLNILLIPLAIMLDVTPFVQILIVLWNFGFIMNQVLTVHGLNSYLESSGFYRGPAFLGAAWGALGLFRPALWPHVPVLMVLGFLAGGFFVGWSRWLYSRVRDTILFGPQLVLHALGQIVRQSLEFTVSGASPEDAKSVNMAFRAWVGPREDRPLDSFSHFINLKTVVWVVGLLSMILNLFALANLDMLNVLLLLPSLLFSVSTLIGPFVMTPKVGRPVGKGVLLPKILGWLTTLAIFTSVSLLMAQGGWPGRLGTLALLVALALLLRSGLKYLRYRHHLQRQAFILGDLLNKAGLDAAAARQLVPTLIRGSTGDAAALVASLQRAGLEPDRHPAILQQVEQQIRPWLRGPAEHAVTRPFGENRWVSEFCRSFALSLLVLIWFFIVPLPGLFVFTCGQYRFALSLGTVLLAVCAGIGVAVLASWLGAGIHWLDRFGRWRGALGPRVERAFAQFEALVAAPGRLTAAQVAAIYAAFTDIQTYLDQRSHAHARQLLGGVERKLAAAGTSGLHGKTH